MCNFMGGGFVRYAVAYRLVAGMQSKKLIAMLKELKTRTIVTPLPVLVVGTYDKDGVPDAMNVAWGGQCWDNEIALNISTNHKTTENMRQTHAFTLHIADVERMELADYFGIVSGHDKDKMARVHVTTVRGKMVNAPIIEEFVLAMECEVVSMTDNGDGGINNDTKDEVLGENAVIDSTLEASGKDNEADKDEDEGGFWDKVTGFFKNLFGGSDKDEDESKEDTESMEDGEDNTENASGNSDNTDQSGDSDNTDQSGDMADNQAPDNSSNGITPTDEETGNDSDDSANAAETSNNTADTENGTNADGTGTDTENAQ